MITLLIFAVIGIIFGISCGYSHGERLGLGLWFGFWGAIVGFIVAAIIGTFAYSGTHWVQVSRTPLVSLADGTTVHGRFGFLGSGYVNGSPSFTWYESRGPNNYTREDVDANEASVHYVSAGVRPYYTVRKKERSGGFVHPFGWNTDNPDGVYYDFYVPQGSIVQSYVLDNR